MFFEVNQAPTRVCGCKFVTSKQPTYIGVVTDIPVIFPAGLGVANLAHKIRGLG